MPESSGINEQVRRMAQRRSRQAPASDESDNIEDVSPAARLAEVNLTGDAYAKEYRLRIINRLLMRNVPLDQIAQQLNVSVRTIQRDRKLIADMLAQEARKLDTNKIIGDTTAFYEEAIGMALRAASVSKAPLPMRMLALRTAMNGKKELNNFFLKAGVFDAMPYTASEQESVDDMAHLMGAIEAILSGDQQNYLRNRENMLQDSGSDELEIYD